MMRILGNPFVAESNAIIERVLRLLLDGTRAIFEAAGLEFEWWPWATKYWRLLWNLRRVNGISPWDVRH